MRAARVKASSSSTSSALLLGLIVCGTLPSAGCALVDSFDEAIYSDSTAPSKDMPKTQPDDGTKDMSPDLKDDPCGVCAQGCLRAATADAGVFCLKDNAKVVAAQVEDLLQRCTVTTPTAKPPREQLNAWPNALKLDQSSILTAHYTADQARAVEATFDKDLHYPDKFKLVGILGVDNFETVHVSQIGRDGALLLGYEGDDDKLKVRVVNNLSAAAQVTNDPQARFTRCADAPAPVAYNLTPGATAKETKLIIVGAFVQKDNTCAVEAVIWDDLTKSPDALPYNPITDTRPQGPITLSKTTGAAHIVASYLSGASPRIYNFALDKDGMPIQANGLGEEVTVLGYKSTQPGKNSCELITQGDASITSNQTRLYPALIAQNSDNSPVFITSFQLTKGPGIQTLIGNLKNQSPQRRCLFDNQLPARESVAVDVFRTTDQQENTATLLLHTKASNESAFNVAELLSINSVNGSPTSEGFPALRLGLEGYNFEPLRLHATPDQDKLSILGIISNAQGSQLIALRINKKGQLFCKMPI